MVAIVTASFVCTYSEQLLPLGFWWQGYSGGNPEEGSSTLTTENSFHIRSFLFKGVELYTGVKREF